MNRKWQIKAKIKNPDGIIEVLLKNRGLVTKKQIQEFFNSPQPYSNLTMKQLELDKKELAKAIERIKKAIKHQKSIVVYGDYDADGICATAILWEALYSLGANVMPFIPSREEHGYGLSKKGIDEILNNLTMKQFDNETIKLIITVDNGIVAHRAVDYAKTKGIDVIVTDHHQKKTKDHPPAGGSKTKTTKTKTYDLPKAEAIVWSDKVSGAGVAWVLANELIANEKNNLDLLAMGTIADMMPLIGVNRSFVKYGLEQLNNTRRPGLNALFNEAGLKKGSIESWHIGYIIAPRLNAMGRLESAWDSLRLLCTKKEEKAIRLAEVLGLTNRERQELTRTTFEHAKERSKNNPPAGGQRSKIIFAVDESYNQGVIGLVAGKLVEEFYRPAIVVSKGKIYSKASVRSVNGFNIIEYLRQFEDIFEDLGGHPMAAGFTVKTEKLALLQSRLQTEAEKQITDKLLTSKLFADGEIDLSAVNLKLFEELKKFAPFGTANKQPVFVSRQVEVVSFQQVGMEGKHLKLKLKTSPEKVIDAIAFCCGGLALKLSPGQKIDILYTIEEDHWNGNHKLQLKIKDIQL